MKSCLLCFLQNRLGSGEVVYADHFPLLFQFIFLIDTIVKKGYERSGMRDPG